MLVSVGVTVMGSFGALVGTRGSIAVATNVVPQTQLVVQKP